MNLTREQANALGLGHLWPDDRPPSAAPAPDGYNKLEARFRDTVLAPARERDDLAAWWREPIRLRLAGRTWFLPDFCAAVRDPACRELVRFTFVETKGHMKEDASVKIKVAASLYPQFDWLLVYRRRGAWLCHEVTARGGISAANVVVPWIHGA